MTERQLRAAVGGGLVAGLGNPEPGQRCIAAAVSWVVDGRHSDQPSCWAVADRFCLVRLNDARWSTPQAAATNVLDNLDDLDDLRRALRRAALET